MAEEKIEKHEHEHQSKTVSIKKSTLWVIGVFVLLALLVASVLTGGFGIMKSNNTGTGNAAANTGNTAAATTINPSAFSDATLFPTLGPDNAQYKVIELADFQCPYCALASGLPAWSAQYASQYGDLIGSAGNIEQLAQQGRYNLHSYQ